MNLPPVDSLINPNHSCYYKTENLDISNIIEDIKLESSFSTQFTTEFQRDYNKSATSSTFWHYNSSNKGPKKRCNIELNENSYDSLSLVYEDPIKMKWWSSNSTKMRKSDANCTKPNLSNFLKIRNNILRSTESYKQTIHKQGRISPKQRNILASKICRLKKKAYHESLKIKYSALGIEYGEILNLLDWVDYNKKMSFPQSLENIRKKIDEIHVIRAAGRLDDFIMDLVTSMDKGDMNNPQIVKLSTFNPEEEPIGKFDFSLNEEIDVDNELDFLVEEGFISDFLNSSGSTSFSDDIFL